MTSPFPVQAATLADGLAGRDVCAQSPTGSGKTLAFGLPLVARAAKGKPRSPRALVLAPTRELAAQIAASLADLGTTRSLRVAVFYGGTGFGGQLAALRSGVDIAVACPGRLIDLLNRGHVDLAAVEAVVVDEADRMADMGFLPDVKRILDRVRPERQTLLFTATMSPEVEKLVTRYQRDPLRAAVAAATRSSGLHRHEFWRTTREQRAGVTASLVASQYSSIVFCRTRHGVDRLAQQLARAGVEAVAIHGDRSQAQRERALAAFRSGRAQVLVGTDVASRGLHIEGVDCVLHYDPPEDDDTYVHRSGRTGRAGADGLVISLVSSDQESAARKLQKRLGLEAAFTDPPAEGTMSAMAGATARPRPQAGPGLAGLAAQAGNQRSGHHHEARRAPGDGRRRDANGPAKSGRQGQGQGRGSAGAARAQDGAGRNAAKPVTDLDGRRRRRAGRKFASSNGAAASGQRRRSQQSA